MKQTLFEYLGGFLAAIIAFFTLTLIDNLLFPDTFMSDFMYGWFCAHAFREGKKYYSQTKF